MHGMWRVAVYAVLACLFVTSATLAEDDPVVGKYRVAGKMADGTRYNGNVVVTKRGESYELVWASGLNCKGVGILDGKNFAIHYECGADNAIGVMLFKQNGNGWIGKYVRVKGKGQLHTETWAPVK